MAANGYLRDVSNALKFGWCTMKGYYKLFIAVLVFIIVISSILGAFAEEAPRLAILFFIINWIWGIIYRMGLLRIFLRFADNDEGEFNDLFANLHLILNYFIANLLYSLMVIVGTALFIIPGVIWGIKYNFYTYFIIDKELGPIDALRASAELTDGVKWDLFAFIFTIFVINFLGALALGVGMFATIPTTGVAYAYVYRSLLEDKEGVIETDETPADTPPPITPKPPVTPGTQVAPTAPRQPLAPGTQAAPAAPRQPVTPKTTGSVVKPSQGQGTGIINARKNPNKE